MKVCPQCERENPSTANCCMNCGCMLVAEEKINEVDKLQRKLSETQKANDLLKAALESQLNKEENNIPVSLPPPIQHNFGKTGNNNKTVIYVIAALVAFAILVFGVLYYKINQKPSDNVVENESADMQNNSPAANIIEFDYRSVTELDPDIIYNGSNIVPQNEISKKVLRNLPFAKRGYIFTTPDLQKYFESQTWYGPDIDYKKADLSELDNKEKEWYWKYN